MISVAMATYNGELYVYKQLESILNQTLRVDEVIICDDNSSDRTVPIIQDFICDNNITNWKLVVNEKSLGCTKNFAKAVSLCNGDIIFLSDQDDIWEPSKVEVMSEIMRQNNNILTLNCLSSYIDENDNYIDVPQNRNGELLESNILSNPIISGFCWRGCGMAFRSTLREYVNDIDFDKVEYGYTYDAYVAVISMSMQGFYILNSNLFRYRLHGRNVVGASPDIEKDKIGIMQLIKRNLFRSKKIKLRYKHICNSIIFYDLILDRLSDYKQGMFDLRGINEEISKFKIRKKYIENKDVLNTLKYLKTVGKPILGDFFYLLEFGSKEKN